MESLDSEEEAMLMTNMCLLQEYNNLRIIKESCRTSKLTGGQYVWELMNGHKTRCFELLRMQKWVFRNLCYALKERQLLKDSRGMSFEEQLAIFLFTIGHNERNRVIQERFQHSGETISRVFHKVLKVVVKYSMEMIKPTIPFHEIPQEIRQNPKYYPIFKDCIGAIDGCHISAVVPVDKQIPYIGRKGVCTQNIMAACSFDMRFTFVLARWEGTANDSRIMLEAIRTPWIKFPHAPPGKYYVVDSGYPNMAGFLTPYRHIRYHLQDFRCGNRSMKMQIGLMKKALILEMMTMRKKTLSNNMSKKRWVYSGIDLQMHVMMHTSDDFGSLKSF